MNTAQFQLELGALGLINLDIAITPHVALAIAVHESANFTSHIYTDFHNCFGMTTPLQRETTCTNKGSADKFAKYANDLDSLRDFYHFCRNWKIHNDADLIAFVNALRYCPAKNYPSLIAKQVKALEAAKKYIDPGLIKLGTGTALAAAAAASLYGMVQLFSDEDA